MTPPPLQVTGTSPEPPGELTFGVSGLHCASCVARLEKALLAHEAIATAVVNLAAGTGFVRYDPARLDKGQLFAIVQTAGYTPLELTAAEDAADAELTGQRNWFLCSLLLSLPIMATMPLHHHRGIGWLNLLLATAV